MRRQIINFSTEQLCVLHVNSALSFILFIFYLLLLCIQRSSLRPGTHSFSCWMQRMLNEGSNWTRKKNRVYANYKLQEKTLLHDMQICVSWKQFLSADWLFMVNFAVNFQTKAEKPLCFLITFLSRSCLLFSYVSIPVCCVTLFKLLSSETMAICKQ